jgi:FKBP-type peptidyl-prolyl cis-trans isomerase FkpA
VQFMAEVKVTDINLKRLSAGIQTDAGHLFLVDNKGKRGIIFQVHERSMVVAVGQGIKNIHVGGLYFKYQWEIGNTYKLLVALASDSAAQICIHSAYLFLPNENKWKFIGSRKLPFWKDKLQKPSVFLNSDKKGTGNIIIGQAWCQRSNGSWKNMKDETLPPPAINLFGHIDSVQQHHTDIKLIEDAIASGKIDAKNNEQGVYYTIMKEGTGRQLSVNDTLTVNYRLRLLNDTSIIQETKDKPATFPLKRLIRGWQIGVPLCKVGGKIKLVIPSDLADIPPNSILVFEIEVLDAKSPL